MKQVEAASLVTLEQKVWRSAETDDKYKMQNKIQHEFHF